MADKSKTTHSLKRFLLEILFYLDRGEHGLVSLPDDLFFSHPRIFISTDLISDDTLFNNLSRLHQVGTITRSRTVGICLLVFLQAIYDDPDFILNELGMNDSDHDASIDLHLAIETLLSDSQTQSRRGYRLYNLYGQTDGKIDPDRMNLWDTRRVIDYIHRHFE